MLYINPQLQIPLKEFSFTFSRSSGPGGQNVNKVNSKATLHWHLKSSSTLSYDLKEKLERILSSKINKEGFIILSSDTHRDQGRNVAECLQKLSKILQKALTENKPRKETKPSRNQKAKRVESKRKQSEKKVLRRAISFH